MSDIQKYENLYYYCIHHRTTKNSTKEDEKGKKKRISICNAKIKFNKVRNIYIYCEEHSKECEDLTKEKYMNF